MERTSVHSSTLRSVGYHDTSFILELEFTTRTVYQYSNVPASVYLALMNAHSKGTFFNNYIKDRYRCRKIRG